MFNFEMGVRTEFRYMSRYEVFCNHCDETLGVMDFRTIKAAVFNTLGRGGVLCPNCRKQTCDVCGLFFADVPPLDFAVGPKGKIRACIICTDSLDELDAQATQAIVGGPEVGPGIEELLL